MQMVLKILITMMFDYTSALIPATCLADFLLFKQVDTLMTLISY